jgi:hypothetical protein
MSKITRQDIISRITASEYLATISLPEITVGTDKQIAYANDIRNEFVRSIIGETAKNMVRYARRGNGDLNTLATDYINYNTITKINTSDAKAIIDRFCDQKVQAAIIDRKLDIVDALKAKE